MLRILSVEFNSLFNTQWGLLTWGVCSEIPVMYIFFFQVRFLYSSKCAVLVWFGFWRGTIKGWIIFSQREVRLGFLPLAFPSHGLSRVFCITSVACLIKLFCSSTFSPSVFSSMFCRLCSLLKPPSVPGWERSQNLFWSHLKTSSNKPDWALWWY